MIGHPSSAYVGVRTRRRPRCALNPPRKHTMANPTKEQIIYRVYELWEQNSNPEDRDDEFYHQAERELQEAPAYSKSTIVPG